ncbi:hypothetical protein [Mesorhizobium qingshengii]|uniref:Uncharacterized protein n=1 Tax=Mesorhizobium qingshengii TaxID=1165689 RepID=A0A1G5V4R9_9HYPH|nr:hypothetical protein [Mesorhizobium qingshengii]SDA40376.1 hypothetical protein SAMN02927914_00232 [Mesorhizobium qingshengii]
MTAATPRGRVIAFPSSTEPAAERKLASNDFYENVQFSDTTEGEPVTGYGLTNDNGASQSADMTAVTREELDAKLDRSEARIETVETRINASLDRLSGEIHSLRAEVGAKPGLLQLVSVGVASAVTIIGTILAVLAFGGDRFDGGVQVSSISVQQAQDAKQKSDETAKKVDDFITKVDAVLNHLAESTKPKP